MKDGHDPEAVEAVTVEGSDRLAFILLDRYLYRSEHPLFAPMEPPPDVPEELRR